MDWSIKHENIKMEASSHIGIYNGYGKEKHITEYIDAVCFIGRVASIR